MQKHSLHTVIRTAVLLLALLLPMALFTACGNDEPTVHQHIEAVQAAVAPTCTETGLTEGKYCQDCQTVLVEQQVVPATGHRETAYGADLAATCTEDGSAAGSKCAVCDVILKEAAVIPATGHREVAYGTELAATCTEPGSAAGSKCAVCDAVVREAAVVPATGHTEEFFGVTLAATCTEPGSAAGSKCAVCQVVLQESAVIPATGHTETVVGVNLAATCTEPGSTTGSKCAVCEVVLQESQVIPATGHTETVVGVNLAATCTEPGSTTGTKCAVCEVVLQEAQVIPAKGHTEVATWGYAATCQSTGLSDGSYCSVCQTVVRAQYILPVSSHTPAPIGTYCAATCTESGTTAGSKCAVCDAVLQAQQVIEATGHTQVTDASVAASCTMTGLTEGAHCGVCSLVLTAQQVVEATGHQNHEALAPVAATCASTGLTEGEKCADCSLILTAQTVTDMLEHQWQKLPDAMPLSAEPATPNYLAPTCTEPGYQRYGCIHEGCGETKDEAIPATGHAMTGDVTAPTCYAKGYTTHSCENENCTYSYTDTETAMLEHSWDKPAATCTEGRSCSMTECGASEPALGHKHEAGTPVSPTCTEPGYTPYTCACGDSYQGDKLPALGHDTAGAAETEVSVEGKTCVYQKQAVCATCGDTVNVGEEYERHVIISSVTREPTCQEKGQKKTYCKNCNTYTATYEDIEPTTQSHSWDAGTVSGNVTTYTCTVSYCHATKTEINAGGASADVNTNDLDSADGNVALEDATLGLDADTLEQVKKAAGDSKLTMEAKKIDKTDSELNLTQEQQGQIGGDYVYDLSLMVNDTPINEGNFEGFVTVTLPYQPEDGEDVDNIYVWCILENGELERFEATYSNGYVTFKTNHFSYYTVTRLTPAQRCALYGHSDSSQVVAGSCTADSYTLLVCRRCGRTEKENVVAAPGHAYGETTVAATCVADGELTKACKNCSEKIVTKLPATGHTYAENVTAADCVNAGTIAYTCACGESYSVTVAALSHEYKSETVEPTCENGGYTLHTCQRQGCGHSYKTDEVAAKGHTIEISWDWGNWDKNKGVKPGRVDIVLACTVEGCGFSETHQAKMTEYEQQSTCGADGTSTYTVVFTDKQGNKYTTTETQIHTDKDRPAHNYSQSMEKDETGHWYVCQCGAKSEVQPHELLVVSETKATCTEAGEKQLQCACGYQKTEKLPAAGHDYADGVCTICGEGSKPDCAHENVNTERLELSQYGVCPGNYLELKACSDCGKLLNISGDLSACDRTGSSEWITDYHYVMTASCSVCGVVYSAEQKQEQLPGQPCCSVITVSYDFQCGQTPIGSWKYEIVTEEHEYTYAPAEGASCADGEYEVVATCTVCGHSENTTQSGHLYGAEMKLDLSQYGACEGAWAEGQFCQFCGEGRNVYINCDGCVMRASYVETDGEGGVMYATREVSCVNCGLHYVENTVITPRENMPCWFWFTETGVLGMGDEKILSWTTTGGMNRHDYMETPAEDASCESGEYRVDQLCARCGEQGSWYYTSGHFTEFERMELSGYGTCKTAGVRVASCGICEKIVEISVECEGCVIAGGGQGYVDENGVEHWTVSSSCENCGLNWTRESWTDAAQSGSCTVDVHYVYTVRMGKNDIGTWEYTAQGMSHDYVETPAEGADCQKGEYELVITCTRCDYRSVRISSGHRYGRTTIDLTELGACEGAYAEVSQCVICKETDYMNLYQGTCVVTGVGKSYVGDDGTEHWIESNSCQNCGLNWTRESWQTPMEGQVCAMDIHNVYTMYVGETQVGSWEFITWGENHDYVYTLTSGSCEDGYTYTAVCELCGETESGKGRGHRTETHYETLTAEGICGDVTVEVRNCTICEKITYYRVNRQCSMSNSWTYPVDENGNTHEMLTRTCKSCGLVIVEDYLYVPVEGTCELLVTYTTEIRFGEAVLGSYSREWTNDNHTYDYTLTSGSCEDDYTYTAVCELCGETESGEGRGHRTETRQETLTAEGICGEVTVEVQSCTVCEKITYYWVNRQCSMSSSWTYPVDENGNAHEIRTRTCKSCGLVIIEDYLYIPVEGTCELLVTYATEIRFGEAVLGSYSREWTDYDHNDSYEFVVNGESCEDGYTYTAVCELCGETKSGEGRGHNNYNLTVYDLADYGACGGTVTFWGCPCGESRGLGYDLPCEYTYTYNSHMDENGDQVNVRVYACETCGLRLQDSYYSEERDASTCTQLTHHTAILSVGDRLVDSFEYTQQASAHDIIRTGVLAEGATNCKEGILLTEACQDCDYSWTGESYGHILCNELDRVELSQYGSVCGGEVVIVTCPCGEQLSAEWESQCDFDKQYSDTAAALAEGALEDAHVSRMDGYNAGWWIGTETWQYTCGVSKPQACGFSILRQSYWLYESQDSCVAQRYELWLFGYDAETGQYQYSRTYATGQYALAHEGFEPTDFDPVVEGDYTVGGFRDTCVRCQSYEQWWIYNNSDGVRVKEVIESAIIPDYSAYAGHDGLEARFETVTYEYVQILGADGGYWDAESVDIRAYTRWDGTQMQCSWTYEYDGCVRTQIYVDHDGNVSTDSDEHWMYIHEAEIPGSCSQDRMDVYCCLTCGQVRNYDNYGPNNHQWKHDGQCYVCAVCGLESEVASSGSIIMEDMTEPGSDTITIGYHAANDVQFSCYISLALHTPQENGNDEIILDGVVIEFPEGELRLITFSRAAVQAAAQELGYSLEEYDIRFTFVPVGADGSFDYAITFTP